MTDDRRSQNITISVGGDLSGQSAVGDGISQTMVQGSARAPVTPQDVAELKAALDHLKSQVVAQAPADLRQAAAERLDELDRAVTQGRPNLNTLDYVRGWIADHLPQLAGSVTALIFHPVLGKIVEAGGDLMAAEFRRRFGSAVQA
jgi:hypothetical protein